MEQALQPVSVGKNMTESLPPELLLMVLQSIDHFSTLRSFVHASRAAHATYLMARDQLLTTFILGDVLPARKITITLFPMAEYAEVCVRGGKAPDRNLVPALLELGGQVRSGRPLRLSYPQCLALLTLVEFKGFTRKTDGHSERDADQGFRCVTDIQHDGYLRHALHLYGPPVRHVCEPYGQWGNGPSYLNLYGWRSYRILELNPSDAAAVKALKFQLGRAHHLWGITTGARKRMDREHEIWVQQEREKYARDEEFMAVWYRLHPALQESDSMDLQDG